MPHVITQSCCNDGSCVFACPVNCIHPSPDEPGFATSEMLYIDPVGLRGLRCVRERLPGWRDRARHPAGDQAAAVRRDQRLVLPGATRRREAAADVEAGPGDPGRRGACPPTAADRGHRRVRAGGDVCRRRTAHPAWGAGQRLREAAHALRVGARRGGARSPEHQKGHPALRPGRRSSPLPVLSQRRDRQAPEPRRSVGPPSRRAVRGRGARRPPAGHRRHGPAGHRNRHRAGRVDQRASRLHRSASRSQPRTRR